MRKYGYIILLLTLLFALVSCSLPVINGKNSINEDKAKDKIESVSKGLATNANARLAYISTYGYGISLASNLPTAKVLNDRILTLSGGYPSINEMQKMQDIVTGLHNSNTVLLIEKDSEILKLQNINKILCTAKDKAVNDYIVLADSTAGKADTLKSELDEWTGWFGLKGVFKGLWQFVKSSMVILSIGGVLFLILRFASFSNPIAASIFSVISRIGSWLVNIIAWIIPQAVEKAGNVSKVIYDKSSKLLGKLIDNIQSIKDIEKRTGKDATLKEVLIELDKSLDTDEKEMINKIKKEMGY